MPTTPAEWLPVLAKRLDDRAARVALLRSYVDGNAPLPEMGRNTRAAWIAFQKKARTNYGGIACTSYADRIRAQGVRVGSDDKSAASLAARRIWRDNRMVVQIADAVWDMVSVSVGYLVVGADAGRALITAERPDVFYAEPDPVRPWRSRAAIKVVRDDIEQRDYSYVWATGRRETFSRPSVSQNGMLLRAAWLPTLGEWELVASETFDGPPPVYILDRREGKGLIEPHLDVLDRINLGKLQRLVITAKQAYKQRALKGGPLPETDEAGNPIDYSKVFEPDPGALWDLPEGIDIWESQDVDIRPLLDGEKQDARDFAGVSGTPISMLIPDGQNQSAEGASNTTAQQVMACNYDIARLQPAVSAAVVSALRVEGIELDGETVEVDFMDPERVTLAEQMDAVSKAIAGGMALQTAQKHLMGWSQDQIEEDERNRRKAGAQSLLSKLPTAAVA